MTAERDSTMTLEQVAHMLRCASQDMVNPRYRTKFKIGAYAIEAHLVKCHCCDLQGDENGKS